MVFWEALNLMFRRNSIISYYSPGTSEAPPNLFLELPGDECKAPRDNLRIDKTEDMLLLATLLKRAGNTRYFLQLQDRSIIPDPVGEDESGCSNPAGIKSRIKRSTVLRCFRNGYFPFRQDVATGTYWDDGDRYMIREFRNVGRWVPAELSTLAKGLKWPVQIGDQLLSNLHTVPLLSWPEIRSLKTGEVYCPLDGPVAPIKMLTGCSRRFLCPSCLGQFQHELLMIP
jgi:hypothetical protein